MYVLGDFCNEYLCFNQPKKYYERVEVFILIFIYNLGPVRPQCYDYDRACKAS